eukprot:5243311-Pleurochrysis_carterae.AAC.1
MAEDNSLVLAVPWPGTCPLAGWPDASPGRVGEAPEPEAISALPPMGPDDSGWVGPLQIQKPTLLRVVETNRTGEPDATSNPDAGRRARLSPRPSVCP